MATLKEMNDASREEAKQATALLQSKKVERDAEAKKTQAEIDRLEDKLSGLRDNQEAISDSLWYLEAVEDTFDLYEQWEPDEEEEQILSDHRLKISGILKAIQK